MYCCFSVSFITFRVLMFVFRCFMYVLLCSYVIPVTGLLADVAAHDKIINYYYY